VITATAASDIFTQDIEDLPEEVVAEIVGRTPARATVVSRQVAPPEDSPERDALYASLQDIATAGTEAYAQSWQGLTADQRKMIGGAAHEGLKQKAAQADAEVAG
jgi:hypothetical protein